MRELSTTQTSNNNMRRLLSTRQAGEYLGIDASTVRRLIYAGVIPVIRCFKSYRVDKEDLNAFVAREKDVL